MATKQDLSAAERAYRELRDGIIEGRLAAGEMLSESRIAADLEMSRTPVRTALSRLQDEQWITIYPKRGALVLDLSERTIEDIADTRIVLESAAMARVSDSVRRELADRLNALIDAQSDSFEKSDLRGFIDRTIAFHRSFVLASENTVLIELSDRLADRQRYMLFKQGARLLERREYILAEHRKLVAALADGDHELFARTLRGHITDTHAEHHSTLRTVR